MSMPHAVQFYNDDVFLIETICSFIKAGSEEGTATIVMATEKHREELHNTVLGAGIPGIEDKIAYFDAGEMLSAFMVDGWPNQSRFTSTFGPIVRQAALAGPVRIFGEMVAVLWAEEKTRAAIRVEELWKELATQHAFSLLCAYPMSGFPKQKENLSFLQVCHTHSHVYQSE